METIKTNSSIEDIIRPIRKAPQIRSDHDIFLIQEVTKDIPFFQKYILEDKADVHQKSCKHMTYEKFENGDTVFSQGDKGSKFYIILEGKVGIFIKNKNEQKKVKELKGGESFGELALINDAPRSASIKCISECHFAVLDKKNYITLFQQILDNEIKKEVSFYPEIELFSNWNYNKIKSFYNHSFRIKVKKGDKIITESDPIDAIYIIVSGEFVVKKRITNESDKFQKRGDLQQLKRQNLSQLGQAGNRLFIMSRYEIFGQENAEEEDPRFYYGVECHSFEGNLIYIKFQDYMKIIMKDDSQREYMQNYSQRRVQRVQNRIKEVSQALNLQSSKDQNSELTVPFERTRTISHTMSIAVIAAEQADQHDYNNQEERLQVPEIKRSIKKRRTCIDVLGDENRISNNKNNDSQNTHTFLQSDVEESTPISQMLTYELKGPRLSHQSNFTNYNQQRSTSEFTQGRGDQSYKSQRSQKLGGEVPQVMKIRTKFNNPLSLNNSSQGNNESHNNKFDDDSYSKNTPQSLNSTNQCYTPVSVRKGNVIIPSKKAGTLSNFCEILSPTKPHGGKNCSPQLNNLSSINLLEDEETAQNTIQGQDSQKLTLTIQKNQNGSSKYIKPFSHTQISMKFHNDNTDDEGDAQKQQEENSPDPLNSLKRLQSVQFLNNQKMKDDILQQKSVKKQGSIPEQQDQEYEQLHPLVKGFHEQLKVRFYNKFKHGSIEDLKTHMSYSPIQTLQVDKLSLETVKGSIRPVIFSNKKKQESKTKEIREYEQKLKQLIRSDCEIPVESISPLKPKSDKLFNIKLEQNSPIQTPHGPTKDPYKLVKKSLLNIFQTTIHSANTLNNNNSQFTQIGGSLLKQHLANNETMTLEKPANISGKHTRMGSLDSNIGVQKLIIVQQIANENSTQGEEKKVKQLQNLSCLPVIQKSQSTKNSPFVNKKPDLTHSTAKILFKQLSSFDSNKSATFIPNTNYNEMIPQIELSNKLGSISPKQYNNSLDLKNNQFLMSTRVGFRGQKGFNCSQFNLRKDKFSYYNS